MRLFKLHVITEARMQALLGKIEQQTKASENLRCATLLENLCAEVARSLEKNSGTRLKQQLNEQVKLITQKVLSEAAKLLKESING